MTKIITIFFCLLFDFGRLCGQDKPLIDTGMLGKWPSIAFSDGSIILSDDAHYVSYVIYNQPVSFNTLVLRDLRSTWKREIVGKSFRPLFFSADSRQLCWQQKDSIWLLETKTGKNRLLGLSKEVSYPSSAKGGQIGLQSPDGSFRLISLINGAERIFTSVKSHRWLTKSSKLFLSASADDLKVLDLKTGIERSFSGVKQYSLAPSEKIMVVATETDNQPALQLINLENNFTKTFWTGKSGEQSTDYVFDETNGQLAFSVYGPNGEVTIWYYKLGQPNAVLKLENERTGFINGLQISKVTRFSGDGRWLLFNVRKQLSALSEEATITPVDIWSYRDKVLNPAQTGDRQNFHDYAAAVDINTKSIQLLEKQDDEKIGWCLKSHCILEKGGGRNMQFGYWWPHNGPISYWLVSLESGKRTLIKELPVNFKGDLGLGVSPGGRWIIYWDPGLGHFFRLDPQTGKVANVTAKLPTSLVDDREQDEFTMPVGIFGWYPDDSAFLVYDNYDIWRIDPSGEKDPVNVTGSYGNLNKIKLRSIQGYQPLIDPDKEMILTGFDVMSKYNGFFSVEPRNPNSLQMLTMGPYTYYQIAQQEFSFNSPPVPKCSGKGKNRCWIVIRQSATEFPNLFASKDLKTFTALTNLQPHKSYNWLTSEVISWRMYNGQLNTGVLYKPENFDSTKKYPVLFNYYQKLSHRCFQFPMPGLTDDNINIPWFVSRGYLVFTPDIQYTVANTPGGMTIGEAAYNTVASAAEYLAGFPYIDKDKMALQGHSFGGQETVAIIAKSNLFAAAAEMAGTMDNISSYLTLIRDNESETVEKLHKQDNPQLRMGASPWERPDIYQRNSPVHNAREINTPLFIVHNKKDGSVHFNQGVEMYMALRRMAKPCWLLQYDNSGHVLADKNDALDYTIRLTQYFDHYLKDRPAPQWMTMNGLAMYKGKSNLYALDSTGNCMKNCKVCLYWNHKENVTAK